MRRVIERLLNLLAFLRTSRFAVTANQIRWEVPGYDRDGDDEAFRRMFERDKALLRDAGIPLETVVLDEFTGEQGYRLPPERFEMADPDLSDEELAALQVATRIIRVGSRDVTPALHKLGGAGGDTGDVMPAAHLADVAGVSVVFEAVSERRVLLVTYNGRPRRLRPYALLHTNGRWYVAAAEAAEGDAKLFRVDRADDWTLSGAPGAFERPDHVDVRGLLPGQPWEMGDESLVADVCIDDDLAWWVERQTGLVRTGDRDGAAVFRVPVANRAAFLSWVVDLGPSAEVLGPRELRAAVVDRIRGVA